CQVGVRRRLGAGERRVGKRVVHGGGIVLKHGSSHGTAQKWSRGDGGFPPGEGVWDRPGRFVRERPRPGGLPRLNLNLPPLARGCIGFPNPFCAGSVGDGSVRRRRFRRGRTIATPPPCCGGRIGLSSSLGS